jgi:hypothetical protein
MCCGGTVATMCASPSGQRSASAARFCAVLRRKLPQVFGFACGRPVLPEV